jgi:hypothetical protein
MLPLTLKAPYDKMTLLKFGGSVGPPPGSWVATPLSTLTHIDSAGTVTNELTGTMHHARWFASGVLLPDGKVLAVGGADKDHAIDPSSEIAVRVPELYDPATGTWAEVAPNGRDRTYHNSAVLLPDMRVLFGGHTPLPPHYGGPNKDMGGPFANNDRGSSSEVWSPPYLHRGPRPRITSAQAGVAYGERFNVGTPEAGEIESVRLIKTPTTSRSSTFGQPRSSAMRRWCDGSTRRGDWCNRASSSAWRNGRRSSSTSASVCAAMRAAPRRASPHVPSLARRRDS